MNPRDFCKLAGFLATRPDPAALRSAISRAYYSLFLVVSEYLRTHGIPLPENRAESHKKLYFILFNCQDNDLKLIASELNDLRESRNVADYEMDDQQIQNAKSARAVVLGTDKAIARFDNLCEDSTRMANARTAMARYAQDNLRLR